MERHYRLRKGVDLVEKRGKWYLLSHFPLKAVRISWRLATVLGRLTSGSWKPLRLLHLPAVSVPVEALEAFLSSFVKAGFLEEEGHRAWEEPPMVSVIIPVQNRPEDIRNCLDSLLELDYPRDRLEVVVIDDASTDETPESLGRYSVNLKRNPTRRGASYCRNLGASLASGEILCFLDSDCTVAQHWLSEIVEAFRDPQVAACGGMVDSQLDHTPLDRYEQVKSSLLIGRTPKDSRGGDAFFYVPSCNMAVRKHVFMSLGGFRECMEVGEDVDLCWRLVDSGHVLEYRPSARVFHRHRNSMRAFCRRRFEYGTSEPLLQGLHPGRRKVFPIWPKSLAFWVLIALGLQWGKMLPWCFAIAWLLADACGRLRKATRADLPLKCSDVFLATLRSHLSFLYHLGFFFSRYYLWIVPFAALLSPLPGIALCGIHLAVGCVQYLMKKPRLDLPRFLLYFSLEQLSYQTGVWWGCVRTGLFSPVIPKVSVGRPSAVKPGKSVGALA